MGWLKNLVKKIIIEVIKDTELDVEMVDGKPVWKVKFKKEI